MDACELETIGAWIVERGLAGADEVELLHGFCERCAAAGLPVSRAMGVMDTLHPVYEGRAFFWSADQQLEQFESLFMPSSEGLQDWYQSPFYQLFQSTEPEFRRRLELGETDGFRILSDMREQEQTDYFAMIQRFEREGVIGDMDCFISRWTTRRGGGFTDADLDALRRLVPALGLAIKARSLARVAESLVETYLGRDPGRRVLRGRMTRGTAEKIHAVLWFSDMEGYTGLSQSLPSDQLIPLLNDYADAVVSAIHAAGGDVLKLMGDGVLAIFEAADPAAACRSAIAAEADLRKRLADLAERRAADGRPTASIYLGLHVGDVFYGNIGSKERLDFTVIGLAVNEVSRIASMCHSVGRPLLISSAFREALPDEECGRIVSVGRYALRGVDRAQDLFTILD